MKDDSFTLALRWIFGVAAVLWISYMLGIAFGVTKNEAPAWVQAIGSVGAIAFTWWMFNHQQKVQMQQKRMDELQRLMQTAELCNALAKDVHVVLGNISGKFSKSHASNEWDEIGTERLDGLLSAIDALFSKDIPAVLFSSLLPVQRETAYTLTAVRQYNREAIPASAKRVIKAHKRHDAVKHAQNSINSIVLLYQTGWIDELRK